jgi:cysteine desulfurase family protein (TIGR01976 family)
MTISSTNPITAPFDLAAARARFSSLRDNDFAFFDAPGGSQVPDEVGVAISDVLRDASANLGAFYATSERVARLVDASRKAAARFMGGDPENIVFGPNMTSLNFTLTRTAARTFEPGDEIVVTRLDHDGNVAPWRELAHDLGLVLRIAEVTPDLRVDVEHLASLMNERTRVVAFPWASNAVGSIADATEICRLAHEVGAITWVDAVHYAAHREMNAREIGADVLLCSPYKFCGPHLGMAHVEPAVADAWRPYKVEPRGLDPLGARFETGTLPYELLGGLLATFNYLDSLGGLGVLGDYEDQLGRYLIESLPDEVEVFGPALQHRVPTFLMHIDGVTAESVARSLAVDSVGVWHHDHWYAVNLPERLPFKGDTVRMGLLHYNTVNEVDRLVASLERVISKR